MEKLIVGQRYKIDPVTTAEFVETRKKRIWAHRCCIL